MFLRLAVLKLGREATLRLYPDAAALLESRPAAVLQAARQFVEGSAKATRRGPPPTVIAMYCRPSSR